MPLKIKFKSDDQAKGHILIDGNSLIVKFKPKSDSKEDRLAAKKKAATMNAVLGLSIYNTSTYGERKDIDAYHSYYQFRKDIDSEVLRALLENAPRELLIICIASDYHEEILRKAENYFNKPNHDGEVNETESSPSTQLYPRLSYHEMNRRINELIGDSFYPHFSPRNKDGYTTGLLYPTYQSLLRKYVDERNAYYSQPPSPSRSRLYDIITKQVTLIGFNGEPFSSPLAITPYKFRDTVTSPSYVDQDFRKLMAKSLANFLLFMSLPQAYKTLSQSDHAKQSDEKKPLSSDIRQFKIKNDDGDLITPACSDTMKTSSSFLLFKPLKKKMEQALEIKSEDSIRPGLANCSEQ